MKVTEKQNLRMATMTFAEVYPHYVNKVLRKGRTIEELHEVIEWMTGYSVEDIHQLVENQVSFEVFFQKANVNANVHLIKGVICGYRIEEIENPLSRLVRCLDKLVDELANGKKMEKILRAPKSEGNTK